MENKEFQPLDGLFSQLKDQELGPPSASWAQMESLLDSQENIKKRGGWIWWTVAAALVPLFLFSLILWMKPAPEKEILAGQQMAVENEVLNKMTQPNENQIREMPPKVKATGNQQIPLKEQKLIATQKLSHPRTLKTTSPTIENEKHSIQPMEIAIQPENETLVKNELKNPQPDPSEVTDNQNIKQEIKPEDDQIASIEFRPSNPGQSESEPEVASVEILHDRSARARLIDTWNKIKNTDPSRIPVVEQTRDNLMALLNFKK